ncbi:uncharacterized protein LOC130672926 [Microplitis mediator]|uniref:uncharacterized protein LOC130672926 n=1 Tax=Microplitis mediator TaxID=375433 RepID=UPI002552BD32|nr:uncharacterized protein LOC130672926 [Microplitis mediator]
MGTEPLIDESSDYDENIGRRYVWKNSLDFCICIIMFFFLHAAPLLCATIIVTRILKPSEEIFVLCVTGTFVFINTHCSMLQGSFYFMGLKKDDVRKWSSLKLDRHRAMCDSVLLVCFLTLHLCLFSTLGTLLPPADPHEDRIQNEIVPIIMSIVNFIWLIYVVVKLTNKYMVFYRNKQRSSSNSTIIKQNIFDDKLYYISM